MRRRLGPLPAPPGALQLLGILIGLLGALTIHAQDRLCDSSIEDCRDPILEHIRREAVGIDVAFQRMSDASYAHELIRRWRAGVPVRVLTDARIAEAEEAEALRLLRQAGVPVRQRKAGPVLRWNLMLFAGQRVVQFTGADEAPHSIGSAAPAGSNDETILISHDPVVVDSFMTSFEDAWVAGNALLAHLRRYPRFEADPELLFAPDDDFVAQSLARYAAETAGIDATVPLITDRRHTDALAAARARGVPVRLITAAQAYRNAEEPWHAWNVDRLYAAGIDVRLQHRPWQTPVTVLHGQGLTVLGSSAWSDSSEWSMGHDYFTTKASIYAWSVNRFDRRWHNRLGVEETVPFTPLPPDAPVPQWPADGATGQPLTVTLQWHAGPWGHKYDVALGTDPGDMRTVLQDMDLGPSLGPDDSISLVVSDLAPSTAYYWRVTSRTMANLERESDVWRFETGDGAAEALLSDGTSQSGAVVPRTAVRRNGRAAGGDLTSSALRQLVGAANGDPFRAVSSLGLRRSLGAAALPTGRTARVRPSVRWCAVAPAQCAALMASRASYPGREPTASWRADALKRIERIRKADFAITVLDAEGQPVEGAEVSLRLARHRFAFGSAVSAYALTADTEDSRRYREIVERSFNRVVFENDLKWHNWIKKGDMVYNRDNLERALAWLNARNIEVRGHYGVWGRLTGDARLGRRFQLSPSAFGRSLIADAVEQITAIGARVREWDVVNHPNGRDEGTLLDLLGPEFYDYVFQAVADAQPDVRRYINEGDVLAANRINRDRYYALIEQMLARGAPVQGIGIMGHFFSDADLVSPEELLRVFDRYAAFGLPIQITEFDIWTVNEVLQADFTRDFLIAAFSHPAVEGVVMWGFWEGRHWYPPAALYRMDWSPKPNALAWEDLVLRRWWTAENGVTDGAGWYGARGFHGEYEVQVHHGGRAVSCRLDIGPGGFEGELRLEAVASMSPVAAQQPAITCVEP